MADPTKPPSVVRDALGRAAGLEVHGPSEGMRFGPYEIVASIGKGGMGEIYLARKSDVEHALRLVALKVLAKHQASSDRELIAMFMDEASIMAQINHPNVLRVLEFGREDDGYYLAMEYLQGRPLVRVMVDAYTKAKGLDYGLVAAMGADAARGLAAAHVAIGRNGQPLNVVHRDVSPQNIFVTYAGATKVIDFGVARASERWAKTAVGQLKGKAAYMSPEQIDGQELNHQSDVFSLGICLWEMAAGRRLFKRDSDWGTMNAVIEGPVISPTHVRGNKDPKFDAIVLSALERDRHKRTSSAASLEAQLTEYAERNGTRTDGASVAAMMSTFFGREAEQERSLIKLLERRFATEAEAQKLRQLSGISPRPGVREVTLVGRGNELSDLDAFETVPSDLAAPDRQPTVRPGRQPSVEGPAIVAIPKQQMEEFAATEASESVAEDRSAAVQRAVAALQAESDRASQPPKARATYRGPVFAAGRVDNDARLPKAIIGGIVVIGLLSLVFAIFGGPKETPPKSTARPTGAKTKARSVPEVVAPPPRVDSELPSAGPTAEEVLRDIEAHGVGVSIAGGKYELRSKKRAPVVVDWGVRFTKVEEGDARGFLAHSSEPGSVSAVYIDARRERWVVRPLSVNDCRARVLAQPLGVEVGYGDTRLVLPYSVRRLGRITLIAPPGAERLEIKELGLSFGYPDLTRKLAHCSEGFDKDEVTLKRLPPGKYALSWMGGGRVISATLKVPSGGGTPQVTPEFKKRKKQRRRRRRRR